MWGGGGGGERGGRGGERGGREEEVTILFLATILSQEVTFAKI